MPLALASSVLTRRLSSPLRELVMVSTHFAHREHRITSTRDWDWD
jgi:hypothetical protein